MKPRHTALVAAALLALPAIGDSDSIVDTGAPTGTAGIGAEMRAGRFSVESAVEIESIEQLLRVPDSTTVTVTVRTDAGVLPGEVLFATETIILPTGEFEWAGASGLRWALPTGTYWATLEYRGPDEMAPFTRPVGTNTATYPEHPLAAEAIGFSPDFDVWQIAIGKTGWRMGTMASPSVTSESATGQ